MDQILHTTQLEKDLLKIEKKITKYNYHKEYKYNRKYLKGLTLKFNLALCEDSEHLLFFRVGVKSFLCLRLYIKSCIHHLHVI